MIHGNHSRFGDRRMAHHRVLERDRANPFTAGFHEIFRAIAQINSFVRGNRDDVAGAKPAVIGKAVIAVRSAHIGARDPRSPLVAWVKDGKAPPTTPPIAITSAGPPAVIARDANGNSSGGGIRLAAIAVPIAVNTGQNTGPGFCWLYGSHVDFEPAKLASLYPTHAAYVAAVRAVREQNVKAGYILRPDADATIAAAQQAAIGTR
jgi:hypothetical protein